MSAALGTWLVLHPEVRVVPAYGWWILLTKVSDGCYVDLESSACGQPGAVQCTELDEGVYEACCPQYTACTPGYNASTTHLRCDIPEMELKALSPSVKSSLEDAMQTDDASSQTYTITPAESEESGSSSASAVSSTTGSMSSTVLTPSQTASSTSTDSSSSPSSRNLLEGGVMAGVVVGAVAATLLIVLVIWLVWRKMRRAKSQKSASGRYELQHEHSDTKSHDEYAGSDSRGMYDAPQEMAADTRRQELWAESSSPKKMPVREVAELEGSGK
jgi:hypothetical protein